MARISGFYEMGPDHQRSFVWNPVIPDDANFMEFLKISMPYTIRNTVIVATPILFGLWVLTKFIE